MMAIDRVGKAVVSLLVIGGVVLGLKAAASQSAVLDILDEMVRAGTNLPVLTINLAEPAAYGDNRVRSFAGEFAEAEDLVLHDPTPGNLAAMPLQGLSIYALDRSFFAAVFQSFGENSYIIFINRPVPNGQFEAIAGRLLERAREYWPDLTVTRRDE